MKRSRNSGVSGDAFAASTSYVCSEARAAASVASAVDHLAYLVVQSTWTRCVQVPDPSDRGVDAKVRERGMKAAGRKEGMFREVRAQGRSTAPARIKGRAARSDISVRVENVWLNSRKRRSEVFYYKLIALTLTTKVLSVSRDWFPRWKYSTEEASQWFMHGGVQSDYVVADTKRFRSILIERQSNGRDDMK